MGVIFSLRTNICDNLPDKKKDKQLIQKLIRTLAIITRQLQCKWMHVFT